AFYLLTAKHFWRGAQGDSNAMKLLREIAYEDLPTAGARAKQLGVDDKIPEGFGSWFARCVTREPKDRFVDAVDAQIALAPVLGTPPVALSLAGPSSARDPMTASPEATTTSASSNDSLVSPSGAIILG